MRILTCMLAMELVAACGDNSFPAPNAADVARMSSDQYVTVADVTVVAPLIVLPRIIAAKGKATDGSRQQVENSNTALNVDDVQISLNGFGGNRDTGVCDKLTREWSRMVCANASTPLLQILPQTFFLVDSSALATFVGFNYAEGGSLGEEVRSLEIGDKPTYRCETAQWTSGVHRCTTVVRIHGDLIAVWGTWDRELEPLGALTAREGDAIRAFMRYGLTPTEDFYELVRVTCNFFDSGDAKECVKMVSDPAYFPRAECEHDGRMLPCSRKLRYSPR